MARHESYPAGVDVHGRVVTAARRGNDYIATLRAGHANVLGYQRTDETADADAMTDMDFVFAMAPIVNGGRDAAPQSVSVRWLDENQLLRIPLGLRDVSDTARVTVRDAFLAIRACHFVAAEQGHDCIAVTGRPATAITGVTYTIRNIWYRPRAAGGYESLVTDPNDVTVPQCQRYDITSPMHYSFVSLDKFEAITARYSMTANMNYDIIDLGKLTEAGMTMTDDGWNHVPGATGELSLGRMRSKLSPFSVSCIAALNMPRVNNVPLFAWARAYAVSIGILPAATSLHGSEIQLSNSRPTVINMNAVSLYHANEGDELLRKTYSIIAAFGLHHLARHHTYKPGDPVQAKSCTAYENAMRTVLNEAEMNQVRTNPEIFHRTAMHPFGLGQTLAVARWGAVHDRIAEPLKIRTLTMPPEVQKVSFIKAGLEALGTVAITAVIRNTIPEIIKTVDDFMASITDTTPNYSALYRHYGVAAQARVPTTVLDACKEVAPLVAGFAQSYYQRTRPGGVIEPFGLAKAACIANIERDSSVQLLSYRTLFDGVRDINDKEEPTNAIVKQIRFAASVKGLVAGAKST